jgi:hypothetical protein
VFEELESASPGKLKISVTLAGLTGFYMTYRLDAWDRFADPQYWWMTAMLSVWAIFSIILFIAEPLFLHAWFRRRAAHDPETTFALVLRGHWVLLIGTIATITGATLGAHGVFF